MSGIVLFCFVWLVGWGGAVVFARSLEQLDPERAWRVESIVLSGNEQFDTETLLAELQTTIRPWYMPWKQQPLFDPVTFTRDLERIRHYYETRGYYQAQVTYELHTDDATGSVFPGGAGRRKRACCGWSAERRCPNKSPDRCGASRASSA